MTWLQRHEDALWARFPAFRVLDDGLRSLKRPVSIVETGGLRTLDNVTGDGNSTYLWHEIVTDVGGNVTSIDIDPQCAAHCLQEFGYTVTAVTMDSLEALANIDTAIDLLYLDSLDVDFHNDRAAAFHTFQECLLAYRKVNPGGFIAVDDNKGAAGKGRLVAEFAELHGWHCEHDGYVKVWRLPGGDQ